MDTQSLLLPRGIKGLSTSAPKGANPTTHKSRRRKNTNTIKCNCPFTINAKHLDGQSQSGWQVKVVDNNHNHGPVATLSALLQHRVAAMTLDERLKVKQMHSENHSANQILTTFRVNPKTSSLTLSLLILNSGHCQLHRLECRDYRSEERR